KKNQIDQWLGNLGACLQSIVDFHNSGLVGEAYWRNENHLEQLKQLCRLLRHPHQDLTEEALAISQLAGTEKKADRNARNDTFQSKIKATLSKT
ncbi:MAG: hypothetical protein NTZ09_03065, partial [Candidatus Hydrogenedentes bacterium]|nr:hypothetical protein [Candidatus Hydrogenedentota bacterium]